MNKKYKVGFFVECLVTIDIETSKGPDEAAKEAYDNINLHDEVRHGNVEFAENIIDVIVDEYNTDGEYIKTKYNTPRLALFGKESAEAERDGNP